MDGMSPVETGQKSQGDVPAKPKSRRYWWLKRIAAGMVLLCLVVMGARWGFGCYAFAQLDAEPTDLHLMIDAA